MTFNIQFLVTLLEIICPALQVQELSSEAILGCHNIAFQGSDPSVLLPQNMDYLEVMLNELVVSAGGCLKASLKPCWFWGFIGAGFGFDIVWEAIWSPALSQPYASFSILRTPTAEAMET